MWTRPLRRALALWAVRECTEGIEAQNSRSRTSRRHRFLRPAFAARALATAGQGLDAAKKHRSRRRFVVELCISSCSSSATAFRYTACTSPVSASPEQRLATIGSTPPRGHQAAAGQYDRAADHGMQGFTVVRLLPAMCDSQWARLGLIALALGSPALALAPQVAVGALPAPLALQAAAQGPLGNAPAPIGRVLNAQHDVANEVRLRQGLVAAAQARGQRQGAFLSCPPGLRPWCAGGSVRCGSPLQPDFIGRIGRRR